MALKRVYLERRQAGLCTGCGEKPSPGLTTCAECRARVAAYAAAKAARDVEAAAKDLAPSSRVRRPKHLCGDAELVEVPKNVRVCARAWAYTVRRLFKEVGGKRRVVAKALLAIMAEEEDRAAAKESR